MDGWVDGWVACGSMNGWMDGGHMDEEMNTKPTSASTPSGHGMLCLTLGLESYQPFSILAP